MSDSQLSHDPAAIANVAAASLAVIPPARARECFEVALEVALNAARQFQPRHVGASEVRWSGPGGELAPQTDFPTDFVDRRSTLANALYRLATATLVDEPVFSAQARVTMLGDSLAVVRNFDAPAATLISSFDDFSNARARELPEPVKAALHGVEKPVVFVVLNQANSFEDVILYTSLFNFARAFAAYQTGPWRSLKKALVARHEGSIPLLEWRGIERAAFRLIESAWNSCWQQPTDSQKNALLDVLSAVKALVIR